MRNGKNLAILFTETKSQTDFWQMDGLKPAFPWCIFAPPPELGWLQLGESHDNNSSARSSDLGFASPASWAPQGAGMAALAGNATKRLDGRFFFFFFFSGSARRVSFFFFFFCFCFSSVTIGELHGFSGGRGGVLGVLCWDHPFRQFRPPMNLTGWTTTCLWTW